MADFIEELGQLPLKTQEAVLRNLSDKMFPLEIDGSIYMIPNEVNVLIDNLVVQIKDLKKERVSWLKNE